jgi:dephospho-CoA kinase
MAALRIGLTGGIGSGKSTVAAMLTGHGAVCIDSDAVARELTAAGGAALAPIRAAFGDAFIGADGALDRARMGGLVFADAGERARLEAILHPLIRERCLELARRSDASAPVVVFEIPLLAEGSGARADAERSATRADAERSAARADAERRSVRADLALDRVLVVDCPVERQLAHAIARGNMPETQVRAVLAAQATRAQRLDIADDVIVNAGSIEALRQRVAQLWSHYTGLQRPE